MDNQQNSDFKLPSIPAQQDDAGDDVSNGSNQLINQSDYVNQPQQPLMMNSDADIGADDLDLIEKKWVVKAKDIVNNTKGNPHAQNLELSKMKAEYIKKRYNKDIRIDE